MRGACSVKRILILNALPEFLNALSPRLAGPVPLSGTRSHPRPSGQLAAANGITVLNEIIQKFKSKQATIGIVGLGYVGLPLALRFADVGYRVIGLDTDDGKVASLKAGQSYIGHISPQRIQKALAGGFSATTDFSLSSAVDALIICVPTPLSTHREPDLI